jgi:hypothetical protein
MNEFGRISVCGSISSYNHDVNNPPKGGAFLLVISIVTRCRCSYRRSGVHVDEATRHGRVSKLFVPRPRLGGFSANSAVAPGRED